MSRSLVICEKPNQARAIIAAVGNRFGPVIPAQGHFFELKLPEEVRPEWAAEWDHTNIGLLWPDGFYPLRISTFVQKDKRLMERLQKIKSALGQVDQVVIATDCDREGEVIGRDFTTYFGFKGRILRAIFANMDKKTLQDAFSNLHNASEFEGRYQAGCARRQIDQTANLSATRTASVVFRPEGAKRFLVSLGRVRTPTEALVVLREKAIRNFKPEDLYTIEAALNVGGKPFSLSCGEYPASVLKNGVQSLHLDDEANADNEGLDAEADAALMDAEDTSRRIKRKDVAEALKADVVGKTWTLNTTVARKTQSPPKPLDQVALARICSQRFKWNAKKTEEMAQALYDAGLMSYPRTQCKYYPDAAIEMVPEMVAGLVAMPAYRGFAEILSQPVIRKGKSGVFSSATMQAQSMSHEAIMPVANEAANFASKVPTLSPDLQKLFDVVARSYMAAIAPDYVYQSTVISAAHKFQGHDWMFKKSGTVPLEAGWKAVYGDVKDKEDVDLLPKFPAGTTAPVTGSKLVLAETKPPARYDEASLQAKMQEVWREVPPGPDRERLKECKGIGTSATRPTIIAELIRIGNLEVRKMNGKNVLVPSEKSMQLYDILQGPAPSLTSAVRTAQWEKAYDAIERGQMTALQAAELVLKDVKKELDGIQCIQGVSFKAQPGMPSPKMITAAQNIAKAKGLKLPTGARTDFEVCKKFLDENMSQRDPNGGPSEKALEYARNIASKLNVVVPADALASADLLKKWIDANKDNVPVDPPSEKALDFARKLATENSVELPEAAMKDWRKCKAFIDAHCGKGGAKKGGAKGTGKRTSTRRTSKQTA